MVWYGIHKIGVPEIDMDHANIDTYMSSALIHGFSEDSLKKLAEALISHFKSEEEICQRLGLNFTQEHRTEHQRLTQILRSLHYGDKSPNEHLVFFKQTLLSHIEEFDSLINPNSPIEK